MTGKRMTFYTVWCFVDACLIAAGLAYNEKKPSDKKEDKATEEGDNHTWDRVVAVYAWGVESTASPP